jgi:hypothetical protein
MQLHIHLHCGHICGYPIPKEVERGPELNAIGIELLPHLAVLQKLLHLPFLYHNLQQSVHLVVVLLAWNQDNYAKS